MYSFAPAAKQRSRSPSIANAVKAMIGVSIKLGSSRIWAIASHHPQTRSPKSQYQTAIAPHHPKTDRLNLNIKQRSPLTPTKPDRLFPSNQTAIALHHTQTRSPIPHTKQRSPSPIKPDRLFPQINQRSHNQTMIASHHPQTRSPIPSIQNSDRPSTPINPIA
jgi:hypothetical protein